MLVCLLCEKLESSVFSDLKCFRSNVYSVAPLFMVIAAIIASVLRIDVPLSSASLSNSSLKLSSFFLTVSNFL